MIACKQQVAGLYNTPKAAVILRVLTANSRESQTTSTESLRCTAHNRASDCGTRTFARGVSVCAECRVQCAKVSHAQLSRDQKSRPGHSPSPASMCDLTMGGDVSLLDMPQINDGANAHDCAYPGPSL